MEYTYIFIVIDKIGRKSLVTSPKRADIGDLVLYDGVTTGTVKAALFGDETELAFLKEFTKVYTAESIYRCVYDFKDDGE